MTTVLTCGVFDLLHVGHIRRLQAAKALGDRLVVGVQYSTHAKRDPVLNLWERMDTVRALGIADEVIAYGSGTDGQVITDVMPDVYCHGYEYIREADRTRVLEVCEELGVRVVLMPRTPGVSTSELRQRAWLLEEMDS